MKYHGSELDYNKQKLVKSILVNSYSEVALDKGRHDNPNFTSYCLKGIKAGIIQKAEVHEPSKKNVNKKVIATTLGTIAGLLLLLLIVPKS